MLAVSSLTALSEMLLVDLDLALNRSSMRLTVMRFNVSAVLLNVVWGGVLWAQVPAAAPAAASAPAVAKSPSALMQPGIDAVKAALAAVKVDKWKAAGPVKDETTANLASINRDVEGTLPGLLAAADAAPDSVVKVFPAYRNVDALYDVVLRVSAVGRLSAPAQEAAALTDALTSLDAGRRALADRMQEGALAGEKRVVDLQASLKAVPAAAPAPVCPTVAPATPAKKPAKKPAAKPAAKPATPPPSN
jgi:hypothetical protein